MRLRIRVALLCIFFAASAQAVQVPFGSQQVISTAADDEPESVFAADLDGDGDLDVVAAWYLGDRVAWYENTDGAGSFGGEQIISTATSRPSSVFAGDVDGDGDLDVLSASVADDKIAWYENTDGAGSFGPQQVISTAGDHTCSVFAADLDGDGDLDVLSAESTAEIAWYENTDGAGSFGGLRHIGYVGGSVEWSTSVFAADVDGDGDVDVLSAASGSGYPLPPPGNGMIAWYENTDGAGSFGTQQVIFTSADFATSVFAADLDGDGDLDVLSAWYFDGISWHENTDGAGSFGGRAHIAYVVDAYSVFAADLDGDGDPDVLSAPEGGVDGISWYENSGPSWSWNEAVISTAVEYAYSVIAADLDGDGDLDVLSASLNDDKIAWFENQTIHRSAVFPSWTKISTAADSPRAVFAADVDGDGDPDVLSASADDDKIAWYENTDGAGSFGTQRVISTSADSARSVVAADVDGDGDLDVVSGSAYDNKIAWYENTDGAGSFGGEQIVSTAAGQPHSVFAADVDGDGDLDVVAACYVGDRIAWYENSDGAGGFGGEQIISTATSGARSVFAADVDGDGDLDVLSASQTDDKIAWYENSDGAGSFGSQRVISTAADSPQSVFAADLDGDGDLDVLSASAYDHKIAWYENSDGAGSFGGQQVISTAAHTAYSVFAADVDGDGDLDVLSASLNDDKIAWYENTDGVGGFGAQQVITTGAVGASSVFSVDVDGDGDLDVLSASANDHKIAWYENRGGQFALAGADTAPVALLQGDTSDLLEIVMTHRGRAGDLSEELATLELLFEEAPGDPLSSAEANALIDTLAVYRDTGSGTFEAGSDTLVTSVDTLSLAAGTQTLTLPDGYPNVGVLHGTPATFFVVVTLTGNANGQTPHRFQVTHLAESGSTAEYPSTDAPLVMEPAANVSSRSVLAARPGSDEDGDGVVDIVETDTGVYVSPTDRGTDPFDPDTDNDGLLDGVEDNTGVYVNPGRTGTNPNDSDSDDDGASDGWEVIYGTDPNHPDGNRPPPVPALGPWGHTLMILVLVGAGAGGLKRRRRKRTG